MTAQMTTLQEVEAARAAAAEPVRDVREAEARRVPLRIILTASPTTTRTTTAAPSGELLGEAMTSGEAAPSGVAASATGPTEPVLPVLDCSQDRLAVRFICAC